MTYTEETKENKIKALNLLVKLNFNTYKYSLKLFVELYKRCYEDQEINPYLSKSLPNTATAEEQINTKDFHRIYKFAFAQNSYYYEKDLKALEETVKNDKVLDEPLKNNDLTYRISSFTSFPYYSPKKIIKYQQAYIENSFNDNTNRFLFILKDTCHSIKHLSIKNINIINKVNQHFYKILIEEGFILNIKQSNPKNLDKFIKKVKLHLKFKLFTNSDKDKKLIDHLDKFDPIISKSFYSIFGKYLHLYLVDDHTLLEYYHMNKLLGDLFTNEELRKFGMNKDLVDDLEKLFKHLYKAKDSWV